ncbi:MAG: DUF3667 domain-containing protein [Flammeovirgaceae bacterium]|nr:DUF3667 domain-containing protein [Flammeovirgaceae bacterium]MDW8287446.1 DUF3667 domain-containing protein [Flammeovirgaceae bacterium]
MNQCKNCGTTLQGNFCHHCGQKSYTPRITLGYLFKDLIALITDIDKGFWHTFIYLFIHPSRVIQEYIEGKRKKYYNPFRYLFLISAAILAIFTYSDFSRKVSKSYEKEFQESLRRDSLALFQADSSLTEKNEKDFLREKQMYASKKWLENYLYFSQTTNPILYIFFYLPGLSIAFYIFLRKRKDTDSFTFAECVVLNAYLAAQISIISIVCMLILNALDFSIETISTFSFLLMIPFYFWAIFSIFKKSPVVFFLKTFAVLFLSMTFYLIVVVIVASIYTLVEVIWFA